jgi:hypothetical protein
MKRSKLALALSLVLVFLSGALVGAFSYRLYSTETTVTANESRRPSPEEWRQRFVAKATTRLQLDEAQVAELNVILDRAKERFDALDGEVYKPQKRAIKEREVTEINAMLNDEQRAEYAKWMAEHATRRRKDKPDTKQ